MKIIPKKILAISDLINSSTTIIKGRTISIDRLERVFGFCQMASMKIKKYLTVHKHNNNKSKSRVSKLMKRKKKRRKMAKQIKSKRYESIRNI